MRLVEEVYSGRRGGRGNGKVGVRSHEQHYHELESQSSALCRICIVGTKIDTWYTRVVDGWGWMRVRGGVPVWGTYDDGLN